MAARARALYASVINFDHVIFFFFFSHLHLYTATCKTKMRIVGYECFVMRVGWWEEIFKCMVTVGSKINDYQ